MSFWTEVLGMVAGICTTIAFLPQVIKTYRSRSARDLSLGMFSIFTLGVILWLAYGIVQQELPIILANAATLVMAATLLVFKITWRD